MTNIKNISICCDDDDDIVEALAEALEDVR